MLNRVEIFDLDGTLWRPKSSPLCVSQRLLTHPKWATEATDYAIFPSVSDQLTALHDEGSKIIVCTNQGGLPWNVEQGHRVSQRGEKFRPYKSWLRFQGELAHMFRLLPQVDEVWASPGRQAGIILVCSPGKANFRLYSGQECHKPSPFMLLKIAEAYPAQSYRFWGDAPTDQAAAIAAENRMPIIFEWADHLHNEVLCVPEVFKREKS